MRKATLIFGCSVLFISGLAVAQQHSMPSGKMTDEDIIKSAMSAAPEAIAKGATIIDVGSDGKIRVVRQGTKPSWEFPRLCRGGSRSLTYPAVNTAGPSTKLQIVTGSTRGGVPSTDDDERLSRTKSSANNRDCKLPGLRGVRRC